MDAVIGNCKTKTSSTVKLDSAEEQVIEQACAEGAISLANQNEHEVKTEEVFALPLRAPSITVGDIFVESRDIKDDPYEALAEAMNEASKGKGSAKSLDLIARSSLRMIDKLRRQVAVLEKRLDKLDKAK